MKNIAKIVILFIFVMLSLSLISCSNSDVDTLAFLDDYPVKTTFSPDESFPEIKILATTKSGKKEEISVGKDMLSGFDTSLSSATEKEYKITYKGKTLTGKYTVSGKVNTKIRLTYQVENNGDEKIITVAAQNFSGDGFYALTGAISYYKEVVKELNIVSSNAQYEVVNEEKNNQTSFVYYNKDGTARISADCELFKIKVKHYDGIEVSLTIGGQKDYYIEMSEGKGIYYVPSLTITL